MGFYNESGGGGGAAVWGAITGTLSDQTDLQTAINTVQGKIGNWIILEDQKAEGTQGGTFTAGDWRTRDLNTKVSDPNNNCVLSSNQFTLTAGNYGLLLASAPVYLVYSHKTRLLAAGSPVKMGSNGYADAGNNVSNCSHLQYFVGTLPVDTTFKIEHRCIQTQTTNGFGVGIGGSGFGTEVYTQVAIEDLN